MTTGDYRRRSKPGLQQAIGLLLIGAALAGWGFWHLAGFMQANNNALGATTPIQPRLVMDALFAVLGVVALLRGVRALLAR